MAHPLLCQFCSSSFLTHSLISSWDACPVPLQRRNYAPRRPGITVNTQETYTGFLNCPPRVVVGGIPEYGSLPMLRAWITILAGVWLLMYCLDTDRAPRRNREAMSEMKSEIKS